MLKSKPPKSCRNRHHSYPDDTPGAVCTGCGKVRAQGPRALGADGAAGLRAALGIETKGGGADLTPANVAMETPGAGVAVPAPSPPVGPPRKSIWPRVARRATQLFDAGTDWAIERAGRDPNEAEKEDLDDFEEGLAQQLAIWFPDVALSPLVQVTMAGAFIVAEKTWNAPALPPKAKPAPAPTAEATPGTASAPPTPPLPNGAPAAATVSERAMLLDLDLPT